MIDVCVTILQVCGCIALSVLALAFAAIVAVFTAVLIKDAIEDLFD